MRRRLPLVALLAALCLLLWSDPASAASAITPTNDPTPLAGVENGRVPNDRLVTVIPGCKVAREAGPSLALLYREAASVGVGLGAEGCYRPIDTQVSLYAYNTSNGGPCTAKPQYYPDGRPRGTSNHGWGKAVDFSNTGGSPLPSNTPSKGWVPSISSLKR